MANDSFYSGAYGIAISGSDIFIAGRLMNMRSDAGGTDNATLNDCALYWKNGVPVLLTDGNISTGLYAFGIAVQAPQVSAY